MADAPEPITSVPSQPPAPYDACSDADAGPFVKISAHIMHGSESQWRTEFPDSDPWMQT